VGAAFCVVPVWSVCCAAVLLVQLFDALRGAIAALADWILPYCSQPLSARALP
jgi:hypothetical protein